jgi:hypothetical protein
VREAPPVNRGSSVHRQIIASRGLTLRPLNGGDQTQHRRSVGSTARIRVCRCGRSSALPCAIGLAPTIDGALWSAIHAATRLMARRDTKRRVIPNEVPRPFLPAAVWRARDARRPACRGQESAFCGTIYFVRGSQFGSLAEGEKINAVLCFSHDLTQEKPPDNNRCCTANAVVTADQVRQRSFERCRPIPRRDAGHRPRIFSAQLPCSQSPSARPALHVRHLKQHRCSHAPAPVRTFDDPQSHNRLALNFRAQIEFASRIAHVAGFRAFREKSPAAVEPANFYGQLRRDSLRPLRAQFRKR